MVEDLNSLVITYGVTSLVQGFSHYLTVPAQGHTLPKSYQWVIQGLGGRVEGSGSIVLACSTEGEGVTTTRVVCSMYPWYRYRSLLVGIVIKVIKFIMASGGLIRDEVRLVMLSILGSGESIEGFK